MMLYNSLQLFTALHMCGFTVVPTHSGFMPYAGLNASIPVFESQEYPVNRYLMDEGMKGDSMHSTWRTAGVLIWSVDAALFH